MQENNHIQQRLYHIDTPPPPDMWSRISAELDKDTETKAVTSAPVYVMPNRSTNKWLKVGLAASLLGFVAMTTLWVFKNNNINNSNNNNNQASANNTNNTNNTKNTITTLPTTTTKDTVYITKPADVAITNTPKPVIITNTVTLPAKEKIVYLPAKDKPNAQPNNIASNSTGNELATTNTLPITNGTNLGQVIIKDNKGNAVQDIGVVKANENNTVTAGASSKADKAITSILNKISVKSDKEEIDSIIDASPYWKAKIQEWRNQLINNGYAPNIINNLDIVELKKIIEQK